MARLLTNFHFYKNTPMRFANKIIHFKSNQERDNYFENTFEKHTVADIGFNFIRNIGKWTIRINTDYESMTGVNYLVFLSNFEPTKKYYAFVTDYVYINDETVEITFEIDVITTFLSFDFSSIVNNQYIEREHLKESYDAFMPQIRKNSDVISPAKLEYLHQESYQFVNNVVKFLHANDLEADPGNSSEPGNAASSGAVYDNIPTPLSLYVCTSLNDFKDFTDMMKNYPILQQNYYSNVVLPAEIFDLNDLQEVDGQFSGMIKKLKNNGHSKNFTLDLFHFNNNDIKRIFGLSGDEDYLLRKDYYKVLMNNYSDTEIELDPASFPSSGLEFQVQTVFGVSDEFFVYPIQYDSNPDDNTIAEGSWGRGSYLKNALHFSNFMSLPIVTNQAQISWAQNTNRRDFQTRTQTISGAISAASNNLNLATGLNAVSKTVSAGSSVLGGFASGGLAGGLLTSSNLISNDLNYYENLKAQKADNALSGYSVSSSSNGYAFQYANDIMGVNLKFVGLSEFDKMIIKSYYMNTGYMIKCVKKLDSVESMSICNFVQGDIKPELENIDVHFINRINELFKNGIQLWHNDGTSNPFKQSLMNNRRV